MPNILCQPCGAYATNCYIVKGKNGDVVIDPGDGALDFIKQNCTKVLAILNTHGHHDHVWDNYLVATEFNAPLYTPKDDIFFLADPTHDFIKSKDLAKPVNDKDELIFDDLKFIFHHFAGHTPGCSIIEFDNLYFSGDFLFARSIGRWDFPYSNASLMVKSLEKAKSLNDDFTILPGHGEASKISLEKPHFDSWIRYING